MKALFLMTACILSVETAVAAGTAPQWTWEAGKQTSNGSISIKSVTGGATYSGSQNPTGAVAKTNQSAVTQPPTVIIQATGSSGGISLGITRGSWQGDLGGYTGADAKCVAAYGTGWRFASVFEVLGALGGLTSTYYSASSGPWVQASSGNNCGSWTSSASNSTGSTMGFTSNNGFGQVEASNNTACNNTKQILCVRVP